MLRRNCGDVTVLVLLLGDMGIEGGAEEMGELTLDRGDDIINVDDDDE